MRIEDKPAFIEDKPEFMIEDKPEFMIEDKPA
jgi:hypothetical protein